MSFGNESHVRVARQTSTGVVVSAITSFFAVPIISETLVTDIPPLVSDTIRARYEEGPVSQGIISAAGDLNFRLHPITLGTMLYAVTGQSSSFATETGYTHAFIPVQTPYTNDVHLNPYTIEIYRGVDEAHYYHDAVANRMTLDISGGQFCRGSVGFICRTTSTTTKTAAGSFSFPSGDEFTWNQASLSLGGAAATIFDNISFTIDNAMTPTAALDGTKANRRIQRSGVRTMRVSGTLDFPSNDEYDKFRAGTEQALDVTLNSPVVVASVTAPTYESLRIEVPTFRYDSFPVNVGGPGRITVAFMGRAVFNTGSNLAWKITLVNTQKGY